MPEKPIPETNIGNLSVIAELEKSRAAFRLPSPVTETAPYLHAHAFFNIVFFYGGGGGVDEHCFIRT